jgi:hypothetical protein
LAHEQERRCAQWHFPSTSQAGCIPRKMTFIWLSEISESDLQQRKVHSCAL